MAVWLQAPYSVGTSLFDVRVGDLRDVLGSTFGAVMLVRLGVLCAAALLLRPLLRGQGGESKADLALLGVLGVAALATWPLTGHPTASPVAGVSVVIDAIHLAAMSVWLGGLVMLVGFLLPRANERELGAILPIWSRWAATAVSALILAGRGAGADRGVLGRRAGGQHVRAADPGQGRRWPRACSGWPGVRGGWCGRGRPRRSRAGCAGRSSSSWRSRRWCWA